MAALANLPETIPAASTKKLERYAVAKAKGVEVIFEIGKHLQSAHAELANHGDGCFGKWCKERLGMSTSSAHRYLSVVEVFEGKDLPRLGQSFTAKALYYLSRDTTVEDA